MVLEEGSHLIGSRLIITGVTVEAVIGNIGNHIGKRLSYQKIVRSGGEGLKLGGKYGSGSFHRLFCFFQNLPGVSLVKIGIGQLADQQQGCRGDGDHADQQLVPKF